MENNKNLIKVIIVKPMKDPYTDYIKNDLETLQDIVGGDIEVVPNSNDNTLLICNEYGKIDGLPVNRALKYEGKIVDIVAGDFIIVGDGGEDFSSLTDEQCKDYIEKFEIVSSLKDLGSYFREDEKLFNEQNNIIEEDYEQGMDM